MSYILLTVAAVALLATALYLRYTLRREYRRFVRQVSATPPAQRPTRAPLALLAGGLLEGDVDWRRLLYDTAPESAQRTLTESLTGWGYTGTFGGAWTPIAPGGTLDTGMLEMVRRDAVLASRTFAMQSALYKRAVQLHVDYVFGRGVSVEVGDKRAPETPRGETTAEDVIRHFQDDPDNRAITRADGQRRLARRFFVDGEVFLLFFVNTGTGAVKVRLVDAPEIAQIITAPDDDTRALYYQRSYTASGFEWTSGAYTAIETRTEYYPDWRAAALDPGFTPPPYSDPQADVTGTAHATRPGEYMAHYRNDNDGARGLPPFYAALKDVRIREGRLEDWARLLVAAATFAFKLKANGNKTQLDAIASQWMNYSGGLNGSSHGFETAEGAQTIFENQSTELSQFDFRLPAGEWDQALQTLAFQISAGTGVTYADLTGDARNGNLASMTAMSGPQQKGFESWQKFFSDMLEDVYRFVLQCALRYDPRFSATHPDGTPRDLSVTVRMPPVVVNDIPTIVSAAAQLIAAEAQLGQELYPRERLTAHIARAFADEDVSAVIAELSNKPIGASSPAQTGEAEDVPQLDLPDPRRLPDNTADALEALRARLERLA